MSKTDKELLELAAKAGGIDYERNLYKWNPLANDGDRYVLAKKLDLWVDFENGMICHRGNLVRDSVKDIDRAIVEVAADIGEAMP